MEASPSEDDSDGDSSTNSDTDSSTESDSDSSTESDSDSSTESDSDSNTVTKVDGLRADLQPVIDMAQGVVPLQLTDDMDLDAVARQLAHQQIQLTGMKRKVAAARNAKRARG